MPGEPGEQSLEGWSEGGFIEQENIELPYDPEKIFKFRSISDEQLEFLEKHNVWESKEVAKEFEALNKSEKTYVRQAHPLFVTTPNERNRGNVLIESRAIEGLNNYLVAKESHAVLSPAELKDLQGAGPYGHGAALGDVFRGNGDLLTPYPLKDSESIKMPITLKFLQAPYGFLHSFPRFVMGQIDRGGLQFEAYEDAYIKFIKNLREVMPRFLTLVARNSQWDIRDLEKYLQDKQISSLPAYFELTSKKDWYLSLDDSINSLKTGNRDHVYTENEKEQLLTEIQAGADVFAAMREYFEDRVKYEDEARETA